MDIGPLTTLAFVLTAGLIGGELASKIHMPRVTGWIFTGVLLGLFNIPGLESERVAAFKPFSDFVLGYIAFTVGSHLHIRSLFNAQRRLFFIVLTEAVITPLIVLGFMVGIGGLTLDYGMLFAAIAIAGAPGTTVLVVREAQARGIFVTTLVAAVALIDMVAVCCFVFAEEQLIAGGGLTVASIAQAFPLVATTLATATCVGLGSAALAIVMTRAFVGAQLLGASLVAVILLAWGLAQWLEVSSILAVTVLGIALANSIADKERAGEAYLNTFGSVLFTAFYTLAGMKLDFSAVLPMAGLVVLFFVGRLVGKSISAFVAMTLARAPKRVRFLLGPALIPHGGVAVGLIIAVQNHPLLEPYSDKIIAVGLSALAINQFVGPLVTRWCLVRAGEANHDRPRLLDFIREQDIVIDLQATDRRDAFRILVDHLFKTHDVQGVDKEGFLERVIARDADESTSVGEGLMIPHGRIPEGDGMVGVIGLSSKGFDWDTPDHRPVHAIVLLATPRSQRDRHLEVLSAFSNAITSHREVREQLYHANTAAHAYEILHIGDAEDFNYFLEDTLLDQSDNSPASPDAVASRAKTASGLG